MKKVIEAIYTYTNSFDPYYLDDNISLEEKQEINKVMNLVEGKTLVSNDDIISSSVYIGDKYYTLLKIKKNKLDDEAQKFFNRGNREIIHGYLIEKSDISDNEYLIDYLDNVTVNDIKAIANEEEMRYEYEKPNITKISTDNFISKNLESINSDLNSNILANLLNFFYISRKQNKKLAIITDYDFVESLREYIKVLYKLFPAKLSNQISYSDYYRGKELIYDITILINDKDSNYNNLNNCLTVEYDELGGFLSSCDPSNELIEFMLRISINNLNDYLKKTKDKFEFINKIEDLNTIYLLNRNKNLDDINLDNYLDELYKRLLCIEENLDFILNINNEFKEQIDSLESLLTADYDKDLLVKIINVIFKICNKLDESNKAYLYNMITDLIFDNKDGRYNLISNIECIKEYFNYSDISNIIISKWDKIKNFFDNYFNNEKYRQFFSMISKKFLVIGNDEIKDYFLIYFISNASNREQDEIISNLLLKEDHDRIYKILKHNFEINKNDFSIYNIFFDKLQKAEDRIKDSAVRYYIKLNSYDENMPIDFFNGSKNNTKEDANLLSVIIKKPTNLSFDYLYNSFKSLIDYESLATQSLVSEMDAAYIETIVLKYNKIYFDYEKLEDNNLNTYIDQIDELIFHFDHNIKVSAFISLLNNLKNDLKKYLDNDKKEFILTEFRYESILRELELIDNNTILNILLDYLGEKRVYEKFNTENKKSVLNNENFLDLSKEIFVDYLNNQKIEESKKKEIIKEIKANRQAITSKVLLTTIGDGLNGIIKCIIFSAIMGGLTFLASYFLYNYVSKGYFILPYIVFVGLSVFISVIIFWFNYKDHRLKNVYLRSFVQVLLIVAFMIGLYIGIQMIFGVIK